MSRAEMPRFRSNSRLVAPLAALLLAGVAGAPAAASEVNVYSTRQEVLIRPLLDGFAKSAGVRVNVIFVRDGLLERLQSEATGSPADVVLTVDAGYLVRMERAGLFQPVRSAVLESNIPPQYRHAEGKWFALSLRARPILYNPDKVKPEELSTYEALADMRWRGRICIRSSGHVYNLGLIASIVAAEGREKAQLWASGFAANLARPPAGGDRDQIQAVAAGLCDIAIANTYYLAGMLSAENGRDKAAAASLRVFWPNQDGRGAHVNVSAAAVAVHARNRDNAVKLIEYLSGDAAQRLYAERVQEYPVKPGIAMSPILQRFGEFKADSLPLAALADHQAEALKIADRAGWR
jgi:iron(III) transport system substrate-binding protein